MKIYSTLIKILVMSYFPVMKWVFLMYILILMLIIILMKMILILLFLSDFWLCTFSFNNTNHLKNKWRINANSMAFQKMVEYFHFRRREKRSRADFYWVMLLMYTIWEYWSIWTLDIVEKYLWMSSLIFLGHFSQNIYLEIF